LVLACVYGCLRFVVGLLVLRLDGDRDREVELLLLRHELSVLRRAVKKPRLNPTDRMILAALARRLPRRAWGGLLVRPETVLGWHRSLVHRKWAAFGPSGVPVDLASMRSAGNSSSDWLGRIPVGAICEFEAS
jgi:hypothetical protein